MKKRDANMERWEFPPDIFWITPDGGIMSVIGHVTAIQQTPEAFGLHVAPETREEVSRALNDLWAQGWVRGRFSDGVFSFHMERPRGVTVGNAYDMVAKHSRHAEKVEVDFADPFYFKFAKDFTAGEFLMQKFPSSWQLNPRRRK